VSKNKRKKKVKLIDRRFTWGWNDGTSAVLFDKTSKTACTLPQPWMSIDGPVKILRLPWPADFARRIDRLLKSLSLDYTRDAKGDKVGGWNHLGGPRSGLAQFDLLLTRRKRRRTR
jgi:hypothetical protein